MALHGIGKEKEEEVKLNNLLQDTHTSWLHLFNSHRPEVHPLQTIVLFFSINKHLLLSFHFDSILFILFVKEMLWYHRSLAH